LFSAYLRNQKTFSPIAALKKLNIVYQLLKIADCFFEVEKGHSSFSLSRFEDTPVTKLKNLFRRFYKGCTS